MKKVLIAIVLLQNAMTCFAQQKIVDFDAAKDWPVIRSAQLSSDGKYVSYVVQRKSRLAELNIVSVDGGWKKEIAGGSGAKFTDDAKFIIYKIGTDSLCVLSLGDRSCTSFQAADFKIASTAANDFLAFSRKSSNELTVIDLKQGKKVNYADVNDYLFSPEKSFLLIQKNISDKSLHRFEISKIDLTTWKFKSIYDGKSPGEDFSIDPKGSRIAFLVSSGSNATPQDDIYLYRSGRDTAELYVDHKSLGDTPGFNISNTTMHFRPDGKALFFYASEPPSSLNPEQQPDKNLVIWNYKDDFIRSHQAQLIKEAANRYFPWVINESDRKAMPLASISDQVLNRGTSFDGASTLVYNKINNSEYYWDARRLPDLCLESTQTGHRDTLAKNRFEDYDASFSPDGHYVIWFDRAQGHCFSYEVATKKTVNLTERLPYHVFDELHDHDPAFPASAYGIGGWGPDQSCYIYDRYDVWMVSLGGQKAPRCVTAGLGRANKIIIRFAAKTYNEPLPTLTIDNHTLFAGFDETTKDNGFIELINNRMNKIAWGAHVCYFPFATLSDSEGALKGFLQKAMQSDTYLFEIESPTEFPNLYVLKDRKTVSQISFLQPQKKYNWLTSELLRYPLNNEGIGEAILYKPQDFDPHKKYPVIFHFYENYSYTLNKFIKPDLSDDNINIPWFVSHGYIVCVPNIYFKPGETGKSVLNSVLSAVNCISRYSYIDTTRLGVQGHSFSGYQVDELITRTNIFKCAVAASAQTDCISLLGEIVIPGGYPNASDEEVGLLRLGIATPWPQPDIFLENSPVMHADQVKTPVLIMHNELDRNVSFYQGVEWFNDLRRLKKKVWMLQYIGEKHSINKPENQLDYSIRLAQFFDHYLMDRPAPKWMSSAIGSNPYILTYSGYDPDSSGSEP